MQVIFTLCLSFFPCCCFSNVQTKVILANGLFCVGLFCRWLFLSHILAMSNTLKQTTFRYLRYLLHILGNHSMKLFHYIPIIFQKLLPFVGILYVRCIGKGLLVTNFNKYNICILRNTSLGEAAKRKYERKRINVCVACSSQGISAEEALRNTLGQMEEHWDW